VLPGEAYRLGSTDQPLWSNNGMKIVMGKPKELGEKSASSILSTMNFTQSHTALNSGLCI